MANGLSRFAGKEKTLSIGALSRCLLQGCPRSWRQGQSALLDEGTDPGVQRKLDKLAQNITNANTFAGIADEYLEKLKREGRAPATLNKVGWLLDLSKPKIGSRPISQITAPEVLDVLRGVEKRGRLETARRLRSTIGSVFRYAIATGRAENDPTGALRGALITPKVKHRPAFLDPAAVGAFLRAIDGFDGQASTVAALRLLPLVFTRPGELRRAEWSEFDFEKAVWTIPAARMKMRREHHVPLARQALKILLDLKEINGKGRLLFPGTRSVERPISENTLNAALRRMGYAQDEVCAHGFRTTASSLLNESDKFSPDAIERALDHQMRDPVRRAYARSAYWKERVEMAQWWADYLDTLKSGARTVAEPVAASAPS